MIPQFTRTVGVAPGTTTMQLGGAFSCLDGTGDCPADELQRYVVPPNVRTGWGSGVMTPPMVGPDGRLLPNPTIEELKGLGDTAPRWGLVIAAGLVAFVGVLGFRRLR